MNHDCARAADRSSAGEPAGGGGMNPGQAGAWIERAG